MSGTPAERLRRMAAEAGLTLGDEAARLLARYLDAMLAENRAVNLTAIRDPEAALVLHALDSAAVQLAGVAPRTALDLGSGNGFPGVAVRALWPACRVTLLDRTSKKVRAIERALAAAEVDGVATLCADAAQVPALHPALVRAFDLVTVRAVGEPAEVARVARPLLREGGCLALWCAGDVPPAALGRGWSRGEAARYELPAAGGAGRARVLATWRAAGPR